MANVFPGSYRPKAYTQSEVLALSTSANLGQVVYVSDTGTLAYSDGSAWNFYGKPVAGSAPQQVSGLVANTAQFTSREAFITTLSGTPSLGSTIASTFENVEFERYYTTGPDVKLRYRVVTSDPTATDPTAVVLVASTAWLTQRFSAELWVEQFGAKRDNTTNDRVAFQNALNRSMAGGGVVRAGDGTFFIDGVGASTDALIVDIGSTFEGAAVLGNGRRRTKIRFKPKDSYQALFSFRGGSGQVNNKFVGGLSVTHEASTNGGDASHNKGVSFRILDTCFAHFYDLQITDPSVAFEVANVSGGFNEFNTWEDIWVTGQTFASWHFHRRSTGTNSLHGTKLIRCFSRVNDGPALRFQGLNHAASSVTSGSLYLYNSHIELGLFNDLSSTREAFVIDAASSGGFNGKDGNTGWIKIEGIGAMDFRCESGVFVMDGPLTGISSHNYTGAQKNGWFFSHNMVAGSSAYNLYDNFTATGLTGANAVAWGNLTTLSKPNGGFPAAIGYMGNNLGGLILASAPPTLSANNGHHFGYLPTSATSMRDFVPGVFARGDGTLLELGTASSTVRQRGQTTGITLNNGRFGGALGRTVPTALSASNGIPSGSVSGTNFFTLWQNAWNESASDCFVVIRGNNVDYRYRLCFSHDGFGGAGYVSILATLRSFNGTAGAVTAPAFSVDTSGNLRVTITTDRDLTVKGSEISWNGVNV